MFLPLLLTIFSISVFTVVFFNLTEKDVKTTKNIILTYERHAKHEFAV